MLVEKEKGPPAHVDRAALLRPFLTLAVSDIISPSLASSPKFHLQIQLCPRCELYLFFTYLQYTASQPAHY